MQVVGGVASAAWGGKDGWMDRLGVEVASMLNLSVSGIFLYASLTTFIPATEKELNLN